MRVCLWLVDIASVIPAFRCGLWVSGLRAWVLGCLLVADDLLMLLIWIVYSVVMIIVVWV